NNLTGPVFDYTTKNIVAGDDAGGMNYWRDTGSTTGSCSSGSAPCFGSRVSTSFTSMSDPPILDGSIGTAYFFGVSTGATNARVVQTSTALVGAVTASVGTSATTQIHAGAFDNAYYTSV